MLERGRPKRVNGKVVYRRDDKGNYLKDKNGRYIPVYEPYKIKVFNTIDFAKSMHYNPFAYISKKNREKDILKFVEVLIKNTSSSQQPSGDDFWVKAEKLLYTAYIALIFAMYPEDEWNFETLIDMINNSECREDDEEFKNSIDLEFEIVECWLNGTKHDDPDVMEDYADLFETKPDAEQRRMGAFALKQFKAYKLAAGKTAKSMLMSFHFIDSLEREQIVHAEKEPEVKLVADEVDVPETEVTAPDKGENFTITDDALGEGGAKAKFRANVDAIKTLKTLEREKRPATAEEKETLSKYVGWGALAKAFDKDDPKWAAEYKELSELLTPQEYAQARSTVNDAFYPH